MKGASLAYGLSIVAVWLACAGIYGLQLHRLASADPLRDTGLSFGLAAMRQLLPCFGLWSSLGIDGFWAGTLIWQRVRRAGGGSGGEEFAPATIRPVAGCIGVGAA